MTGYKFALSKFNRNTWLLLATWALIGFAYFGVQAVLLNLYVLRLGYDTEFIGWLIGIGQLVWAVASLPAGALGTRLGLRTAMLVGIAIIPVAWALLLTSATLPAPLALAGLVLGWSLSWVGSAIFVVNSTPYLMSVSTPQVSAYAFSMQAVLMGLFGFTGSLAAGFLPGLVAARTGATLDQPGPYGVALWLVPLAYVLALVTCARTRPTPDMATGPIPRPASPAPIPLMAIFGVIVFLQSISEAVLRAFFNVYLDNVLRVPAVDIGTLFGVAQILPIAFALVVPYAMSRVGAIPALCLTTLGIAVGLLPMTLRAGFGMVSLGYLVVLAMLAMIGPIRNIFSQQAVSPYWRATMSAVMTLGLAASWGLSAILGGYVIAGWGYPLLFLVGIATAILAAGLLVGSIRILLPARSAPQTVQQPG
jgi:hypothetical protein